MQPSMLSPKAYRCFGTPTPLVQRGNLVSRMRRGTLAAMLLVSCAGSTIVLSPPSVPKSQKPWCGAAVTHGGRNFTSRLPLRVRERRRQAPDRNSDGEARRLTAQITKAGSASELLALLDKPVENANLFNHFHMSAAWTTLARFKKRRQFRKADAVSPVWAKLAARLDKMLQDDLLPPRVAANVFYSVGELYEEIERRMMQVLPKLCRAVRAKARGMNAQAIFNCMLAAVKLQDASPEVLDAVPALAKRIPATAEDMKPQELSNSLWAAAKLQDAAPEVLDAVPAVAKRIPDKVEEMKPQELSNSLWAAAKLQDASPEVLEAVPALAKRMPDKVEEMKPQELSNSLWAAASLQDASPEVLDAVPALAKRIPDKAEDMKPQELSNSLLAAARLQDSSPRVLDIVPALVRRMQETISAMNLQDLSDNFRAVAMLKDASPDARALASQLAQSLFPNVKNLAPEGLRMLLKAARQLKENKLAAKLQAELDRRQP